MPAALSFIAVFGSGGSAELEAMTGVSFGCDARPSVYETFRFLRELSWLAMVVVEVVRLVEGQAASEGGPREIPGKRA